MEDTRLILHVKGTEQTAELPKQVVRAGIAQGQISRSQLIWSPIHAAWKQVRELPHLWPSQKLAPAPPPRVTNTGGLPRVDGPTVVRASGPLPRVAADPSLGTSAPVVVRASGNLPRVAATSPGLAPQVQVAGPQPVLAEAEQADPYALEKDDLPFRVVKWLCIGLGGFVLVAGGLNYFLVDQPLASRLAKTEFASVFTYAHLGAFVQPNALVIHTGGAPALTEDNLVNYLAAVAHSTPETPFGALAYERVSLTRGLMGQYSISGYAWKEFGGMTRESTEEKKKFLLDQMGTASGGPLLLPNANLSEEKQAAQADKAWVDFVAYFTK